MGNRGARADDGERPPLIELVVLDPRLQRAPRPSPGGRTDGSPPHRRRPMVTAGLVALAAVVTVAVVADRDDEARPSPSTAAHVTVTLPDRTPTTSLATTVATVTTAPAAPASAGAPSVTRVIASEGPKGFTWVSFGRSEMSTVDLDTGDKATYPSSVRTTGGAESPMVFADRVVYMSYDTSSRDQNPSVWSQTYSHDPPVRLLDRASIVTMSSATGQLWVMPRDQPTADSYRVAEIDLAGRVSTTLTIPAGLRVDGASTDGLWVSGSGRIFTLARNGALRQVAVGALVATSTTGVLFDDCAIAGPCSLRFTTNGASSSRVGPSSEIRRSDTNDFTDSALSPSGRWLLLANGLLDRTTNEQISHWFALRGWRWSLDGKWLFVWSANTDAVAWNLEDMSQVRLGLLDTLSGVVAR